MKRLMMFLLYINVILLAFIAFSKLELVFQQRQVSIILEKHNKLESIETELLTDDSFDKHRTITLRKKDIIKNVNANNSINADANNDVKVNVDVDANDDAIIVDIYETIGILEVPKLDIIYPILNETTDETLKVSVTAYAGKINEIGNFVIAGHNYKNGFEFGRLRYVHEGDIVKIAGVDYRVFDIFVVEDTAVAEVINNNTQGEKWITLFTCTNNGKNRLVVRAKAI